MATIHPYYYYYLFAVFYCLYIWAPTIRILKHPMTHLLICICIYVYMCICIAPPPRLREINKNVIGKIYFISYLTNHNPDMIKPKSSNIS